ncbi:MAG: sulfite exporter TauE/SafE family protein [Planctomycetia bacterium]
MLLAESADGLGLAVLALVTAIASAVNSVAGGGTILTFPVLVAILPESPARMVVANATSTIGLWPGALAAAWAYRGDRIDQPAWARWLLLPSAAGAIVGSALVLVLPPAWFTSLVPWLILLAAVLFTIQPWLASRAVRATGTARPASLALACGLQFVVAVYGGYFGAGIGILMLAMLGMLRLGDIHRLNAVKNVLGTVVNGTAAAIFAGGSLLGTHEVAWLHAAIMAGAAVIGAIGGSVLARRMPAPVVRRLVAVIGFGLACYYFLK